MNLSTEEFEDELMAFAVLIKKYGARQVWESLKLGYPKVHNELLYYALDQLPK